MILCDTLLAARAAENRPIRVGMVGCGAMGSGILRLVSRSVPGMRIAAISNRTPANALAAYREHGGVPARSAATAAQLASAIRSGEAAVTDDPALLAASPDIDVLLEVTGRVEFGAQVAEMAIGEGRDLVTMNVEMDASVGPILYRRAREAGILMTNADGDQPGVQMNLHRFVTGLGLEPLVCGNIKGLQDHYRTPTTQKGFAERWDQDVHMVTSFADGSKVSMEQAVVANATGMGVARRGMLGIEHRGHVDDLVGRYDPDAARAHGGIVEYVLGAEPAPGVFVLAHGDDPHHRHYLNLYKRGEGPVYCFYRPYHLCYFEVPNTIARAVLFRDATIRPLDGPRVDVVATAKRDLAAGEIIDAIGGYLTYGQCENYSLSRRENLLPMGLAEGCRVVRPIPQDTVLRYEDVELPGGRTIDRLRRDQDALWPGAAASPTDPNSTAS